MHDFPTKQQLPSNKMQQHFSILLLNMHVWFNVYWCRCSPSIALLHTISPMSFASSAVGAVARGCEDWRAAETSLDASTAVECCASDSNKGWNQLRRWCPGLELWPHNLKVENSWFWCCPASGVVNSFALFYDKAVAHPPSFFFVCHTNNLYPFNARTHPLDAFFL